MRIKNPKPDTQFQIFNNQFALFHKTKTHIEYWRDYWQNSSKYRNQQMIKAKQGDLDEYDEFISRYVPKDLPVLEAGCGPGRFVAALQARNYQVIGIDYEPETVKLVNQILPELDVRQGDILALDFPSGSIGAYLSFGVVEHFSDGPAKALAEAKRVLHPKGVMLISVPYLNPARALQAEHLVKIKARYTQDLTFHQYYYSANHFKRILEQAGFTIIDCLPYAVEAFLIREHPIFSLFWNSSLCRTKIKRFFKSNLFINKNKLLRNKYGHMIMFICQVT